jgi:hypothetical protein
MRRSLRLLLVAPLVAFSGALGQPKDQPKAPAPKALYALQLAADPGKTTKLTLRGVGLESATEVRLGEPKSSARVLGKGRKAAGANPMTAALLGDSEIDVEVTLPADVPGGVVPLSLVGPGGEGKPMALLVNDDTPRVAEKEPNGGFREAMPVTAPIVVEATFQQPQDVDVFRLDGKQGERYRIEVQAARFGSPADVMLTLYDASGHTVATGEPLAGGKDSALRVTLPKDGAYFLSAIEGFDQGGPTYVYRLAVRREP